MLKLTTNLLFDWSLRCFGHASTWNPRIRALRLAEETIELAQALDVDKEQLKKLIDVIYSREPGKIKQEMGGVMIGISLVGGAVGIEPQDALHDELRRVLQHPVEKFAQRNSEKIAQGFN